ncbi:MAG TPA: MBL fold metallo-hydrolase [Streptosporangiaceae bacterium]|nr:MBL fold metallo-hydrolase [Streptosporangiaceae bacterium]
MIDFASAAPVAGDLDVHWIHGHRPGTADTDPAFQVHAYDEHTYVLRQSKASTYEAPFIYLLFGNERAVLFDSGATKTPDVVSAVDEVMRGWLSRNPRDGYPLVVAHTHSHGDHVAGDEQFGGRPDTTVVGRTVAEVREFFGFTNWPGEVVGFDLGGRVLELTGIPGHHAASVAVYDPWSGFLLTGDTVYPGRLYAFGSMPRMPGMSSAGSPGRAR